jgi:hypothetical protein
VQVDEKQAPRQSLLGAFSSSLDFVLGCVFTMVKGTSRKFKIFTMVLVVNQRLLTYEGVRANQEPQAPHSVEAYYDSVMCMNPS